MCFGFDSEKDCETKRRHEVFPCHARQFIREIRNHCSLRLSHLVYLKDRCFKYYKFPSFRDIFGIFDHEEFLYNDSKDQENAATAAAKF